MTFESVVKELGIEAYPPVLKEMFDKIDIACACLVDEEFLRKVSKEYNVLRTREEEFIAFAKRVADDEAALAYLNLCNCYIDEMNGDANECKKLKMPKIAKESTTVDIFPMLVLMPQISKSYERYIKRGISHEAAMKEMGLYGGCLGALSNANGRTMLPYSHYLWLCNYLEARIINVAGFNYEVKKFEFNGVYIKNKKSGQLVALMLNEKIHKSGLVLGTPGCKDDDGSWFASYTETESEFVGFPVSDNGFAIKEERHYSKDEWEKILQKGDDCISFHIPRASDFTPENLDKSFKLGVEAVRKFYPEQNIRCITCASWLVSPQLWDIMKPTSNIVAFGKRFTPLPQINSADSIFSCVFQKKVDDYNDLPEETSLQRSMKKLCLDGGYLYTYIGAFEITE